MKNLNTVLLLLPSLIFSQIGINTTNPNAILDVYSQNMGVLLPRVNLLSYLDQNTVKSVYSTTVEESTLVYNYTTNQTLERNFYYWDGVKWKTFNEKQYQYTSKEGNYAGINAPYEIFLNNLNITFVAKYTGTYKARLTIHVKCSGTSVIDGFSDGTLYLYVGTDKKGKRVDLKNIKIGNNNILDKAYIEIDFPFEANAGDSKFIKVGYVPNSSNLSVHTIFHDSFLELEFKK